MKSKKRKKYIPLRSFSWSKSEAKTTDQLLVESTVSEWYDAKHRTMSKEEIIFINSLPIENCRLCDSSEFTKNGHRKDGIQIYFCKTCHHQFNPLTNTIFDSKKIPILEWIEYLLHLFEFHSLHSKAYDNRNSETTAKYWLIKVFEVLKGIQDDIVLDGTVYLDETYFSKAKQNKIKKDGKELRGISRTSTMRTYGKHIAEGSTIVHDEEKSHNILVEELGLKNEVYLSNKIKQLNDKENPLYPVNHLHMLLKKFIRAHGGYDRENLQDWMNLFWFIMNEPKDRYDKVLKFIKMAIMSPKRVKYRDALSKRHDK